MREATAGVPSGQLNSVLAFLPAELQALGSAFVDMIYPAPCLLARNAGTL